MKQYLVAVAAVFVVMSILMFLVMGVLMADDALALGSLVRPAEEQKIPLLLLSNLITALAFVWIYARGVEAKPWVGQGLRFGLAAWLFRPVGIFLINYATMPFPASFIVKQMVCTLPLVLAVGLTTACIYRPRPGQVE